MRHKPSFKITSQLQFLKNSASVSEELPRLSTGCSSFSKELTQEPQKALASVSEDIYLIPYVPEVIP
jgi:hypothetical protein